MRSSSTQLRAAGAVILGKTNLSEWANFRSTHSTQRLERARRAGAEPVRARSQPVRLELRHRRRGRGQPRGVGVGTETDGSIVCPSGANGLVGIKPTVGLGEPLRASFPISHTQDTAGPMARTVADAATAARRDGRPRSARRRDHGSAVAHGRDYAKRSMPAR